MPLVRLTPSRALWLATTGPRLPFLAYNATWHSRQTGWLALHSVRLPGLWLLLIRHLTTRERLDRWGDHSLF